MLRISVYLSPKFVSCKYVSVQLGHTNVVHSWQCGLVSLFS